MRPLNLLLLLPCFLSTFSTANAELSSVTVAYESSIKEQTLNGVVEAVQKATMSAQVSGRIIELNFDVDDLVKKGDVILRVRDTEYKARLQKAEASLTEANANLIDAQSELARVSGLFKDKMISASVFDSTKAQLKASEARVSASKARITEANEQLANTTIRAPYSGVVIKRHIELGETIQPGKPVMTGFSLDKLRIATDIPQSYINAIRNYNSARLLPLSNQISKVKNMATVDDMTIFPFAHPANHTFHVRVNLKKGTKNLYPGMLVKVAFKVDENERLLIPHSSVVHRSEVVAVYTLENQKVKLRQIRLGHVFGNKVEVLAGLTAGELIATDPVKAGVELKKQTQATRPSESK